MKRAIVVGSGAGGATAAKELQGSFQVTMLEAGSSFHPFAGDLRLIEKAKKSGVLFDERQIQWLFPTMKIRETEDRMVLVNGSGFGGTTTISAGNAVRQDQDLKAVGIDLDPEFDEIYRELPISTAHEKHWHEVTRHAYEVCREMELSPVVTPKMIYEEKCAGCGRCVLGCPWGAKWDSRKYLDQAVRDGVQLVSNCRVHTVVIEGGRAQGVLAGSRWSKRFYPADLVVLSAGGLGTPAILQNSGVGCEDRLFVDPVLCVAGKMDASRQNAEIPMPFVVQCDHFIISPYFDFLSFFFNRSWHYPAGQIYSLMIKLADTTSGGVRGREVRKTLSDVDTQRLKDGVKLCKEIFNRLGIKDREIFLGTLNAGHPGGMLPLTMKEAQTLHDSRLPGNLYVADATLFPASLGNPPILTIVAMAKRVSRKCLEWA